MIVNYFFVTLLVLNAELVYSSPIKTISDAEHQVIQTAMNNPRLYQGDIVLEFRTRFDDKSKTWFLWPNGEIPYTIHSSLINETTLIKNAMHHISERTCIKFRRRTIETHFLLFNRNKGCFSYIGRVQQGAQTVSIGRGCEQFGVVLHQLMHAIGLYHTHMRTDRDYYIKINWNNILGYKLHEFTHRMPNEGKIFTEFDYDSVLLLGPRALSKNGSLITFSAKKPGISLKEVHEKYNLSELDVNSINILYNCKPGVK